MRFMLKAAMNTQTANAAVRDGKLASTIQSILGDIKPEAAYFTDSDGRRTAYLILNLTDASQLPAICEPWFLAFNADIEVHLVMTPEDLSSVGPAINAAAKKYN